MDKLQWFKFSPTDWTMGKIQRCPEITQIRFLRLVCLYWNKESILTLEDAEIEIDKEHLDILINKKIIKSIDGFVVIEFLNEQLETISETSIKRRDAVLKRWNKKNTKELQSDTSVLQNDTEESRVEKKRVDKIRKEYISCSDDFLIVWNEYKKYRTNKRKSFKFAGLKYEQMAFDKFYKLSDGKIENAKKILQQSLDNNWDGLFELKETIKTQGNERVITKNR